jgi:hypothetical protein
VHPVCPTLEYTYKDSTVIEKQIISPTATSTAGEVPDQAKSPGQCAGALGDKAASGSQLPGTIISEAGPSHSGNEDIVEMEVDRQESEPDIASGVVGGKASSGSQSPGTIVSEASPNPSGDKDIVGMEVDQQESEPDVASGVTDDIAAMDIDIGPIGSGSNTTSETLDDGDNTTATQSKRVAADTSDTTGSKVPGEHVSNAAPKVPEAPARYIDGEKVSEYEWERMERIRRNNVVLAALELDNSADRLFGKKRRKGKENKRDAPSKSSAKAKKVPWANVEKPTLRSLKKGVPNTYVSVAAVFAPALTRPKCYEYRDDWAAKEQIDAERSR